MVVAVVRVVVGCTVIGSDRKEWKKVTVGQVGSAGETEAEGRQKAQSLWWPPSSNSSSSSSSIIVLGGEGRLVILIT